MNLALIQTGDGSASLYRADLDETYHSRHGALQESLHVFIRMGLDALPADQQPVHVLEVGFGTGLNALLAWQWAQRTGRAVHFTTLEPYPIPAELVAQLDYAALMPEVPQAGEQFQALHAAAWGEAVVLAPEFTLTMLALPLEQLPAVASVDVVFFDAFAPNKQPEVWSQENLARCYAALAPGGILVTYCAQGAFKRNLVQCGFAVEGLPGPPYKKEMVRAKKN